MPLSMFVQSTPQYVGVGNPQVQEKSGFFGAISSLLGSSGQTPPYKQPSPPATLQQEQTPAQQVPASVSITTPLKATITVMPNGQLVLTIVIDEITNPESQTPVGNAP